MASNHWFVRRPQYLSSLDEFVVTAKQRAVAGNREVFSDRQTLADIARYVKTGLFPWDK